MKALVFIVATFSFFASSTAQACWAGDEVKWRTYQWERQACTGPGYCWQWGSNPDNGGAYERYYGYHRNCEGTQERQNEVLTCERSDGYQYTKTNEGFWGMCQVH